MLYRALWMAACLLGLAGCAGAPPALATSQLPWRDQAFGYEAAAVEAARQGVFQLDADLLQQLRNAPAQALGPRQRVEYLLTLLFGPQRNGFRYAAGHTTGAAETWRRKQGDCLSLSILTYATARAMNMTAQVQEVDVAVLYDRRGSFDFVNRHVNVRFSHVQRDLVGSLGQRRDLVVDFQPEFGSQRAGRPLDESAILARFYNNRAAEHLAQGNRKLAYSFFKAAILADPGFAAGYTNLAVLYNGTAMFVEAELLLRRAVELSEPPHVALPLLALHQMLVEQGRDAEARQHAASIESARKRDPYHWIGLGVGLLHDAQYARAAEALERALEMVNGFREVHRYLAFAYWKAGDGRRAREQLALLESIDSADPGAAVLREKFATRVR